MNREELYRLIDDHPVILDGATGSNLQKAGMPAGVCPEIWIMEHEQIFMELQKAYVKAGSEIVYSPTFSANRIKLAEYGLEERVEEINKALVNISRKAVGETIYIAGDMTMTGKALTPVGTMTLDELIDVYKEQAIALDQAGVDLFVVETMLSLSETRAAVLAIKEVSDKPIIASMSFEEDGRSLYGTDPVTALVVLQSLGVDVMGINCSTGPEEMIPMIAEMKSYADIPLLAKPNAGMPLLIDNETVYSMEATAFAAYAKQFLEAGANMLGGCCGTTPCHISALASAIKGQKGRKPDNKHPRMIASERRSLELSPEGDFYVIGERINPTGKKQLQQALKEGDLSRVEEMALEQEEQGAGILDVNLGLNGIDERSMMVETIEKLSLITSLPLCIDTSDAAVMEAALKAYPGRALMNSISLEEYKIKEFLPLASKYGAMFILLPLSDQGLPESLTQKKEIIEHILQEAERTGIRREQIIVDGLVTTVGANKKAALETLETIRYCKDTLHLPTTVGLSNISFGMPERKVVNASFAAMAIQAGLTTAIANPSDTLLMDIMAASRVLMNQKNADESYIRQVSGRQVHETKESPVAAGPSDRVKNAVLKGNIDGITAVVKEQIEAGAQPDFILNESLIPGISEVGELFEKQVYFLPQLIASANAMKKAVDYLEPLLQKGSDHEKLPTIVIATVEGDIHDIGKNLVALMLRNHGFNVIDLGKDVPAGTIISEAIKEQADVIALSALMTTTMMRMEETISLRNEKAEDIKVIIGGAVTTQGFAEEIGADGYSKDAAEAVKLVRSLLKLS